MKIGLSFSRCVKDIVDGTVDLSEVLVIIARTSFNAKISTDVDFIYNGYIDTGAWDSDPEFKDKYYSVIHSLWNQGKLHQPRSFGARPVIRSEYWLEAVLPSTELERNTAAKEAWKNFICIAGLTNVTLDDTVG